MWDIINGRSLGKYTTWYIKVWELCYKNIVKYYQIMIKSKQWLLGKMELKNMKNLSS